ncbi:GNAT family N-acetyltransferase [Sphingorhabdus sp.]|uniref:GNAT family N-acetyltransferase n=1 Tax=Sphingorhabdus sp. TaxID=1902408 RepID=UPI002627C326|nr:GNAT family N-acetyltransferase [Sphingorhabdus sp.]MDH4398075.1 GNAT family N-acetyltransferase [Sphingorhabdus sp.]
MDNAGQTADVMIRMAQGSDADAIAQIYAYHVLNGTASFDIVPRSSAETEQKIADILSKGWPFLIAERDNRILGYAYVTAFRDRPAYGFTCEDSIYVDPDFMGQGVGVKLLRALMVQATQCGFRQMVAVIGGAEPASVKLHSKLGFTQSGRMRSVGRKFGRWLDSVYMQAELGDADRAVPAREPA